MRYTRCPRRLQFLVVTTAVAGLSATSATPQVPAGGPDPREIPVPPIRTSLGSLPGVRDLPVRAEMPDVMTLDSGQRVTTHGQWRQRREEMKRILAYCPRPAQRRSRSATTWSSVAATPSWSSTTCVV